MGKLLLCLSRLKLAKVADDDVSFGFQRRTASSDDTCSFRSSRVSHTEELLDPFDQFQSLQVSLSPESRLVCLTDSGSPAAEAFRLLGVRLRHLRRDRPLKKVADYEHNSSRGQKYGCCQPGLHPRFKNTTENLGVRGRSAAPGFIADVRDSEGIQASVSGWKTTAV